MAEGYSPGGLKNLISSSQDYCAQQFFSEAMFCLSMV